MPRDLLLLHIPTGFKGAIPKVTRLPVWWALTQLLALHRKTPDRNTELRPVPSISI